MEIKIEKGVEIPAPNNGCGYTGALRKMEVGDSFIYPKSPNAIGALARQARIKVVTRALPEGGCRVWRIA